MTAFSAFARSPRGRIAAGVTAAVLAFGLGTPTALADTVQDNGGATGHYNGGVDKGHDVSMDGVEINARMFHLELDDGSTLRTYCIDFETSIQQTQYVENDWEHYPGRGDFQPQAGKVHWILQNSYPQLELAELSETAEIPGLTAEDAITGTQAAVWHFSNGVTLDEGSTEPNAEALYNYLVQQAEELPQEDEPTASLEITPTEAEGMAGEVVGAFEVSTSADEVPLELAGPEGVELQLVDEAGEPLETVSDGDTFGVEVPADAEAGEATVSAAVEAEVHAGRLFQGADPEVETQTLISARSETVTVEASVAVSWEGAADDETTPPPDDETTPPADDDTTPPPDDETTPPADDDDDGDDGGLPVTGSALTGLIIAAVVAVGGGAVALYLSRRRRTVTTTEES